MLKERRREGERRWRGCQTLEQSEEWNVGGSDSVCVRANDEKNPNVSCSANGIIYIYINIILYAIMANN